MARATGTARCGGRRRSIRGSAFLGRQLTGGLTNSGGYYLYLKLDGAALPAGMFDTRGMAWLTLAVSGFARSPAADGRVLFQRAADRQEARYAAQRSSADALRSRQP